MINLSDVRVSTATVIFSLPNLLAASCTNSGFLTAAVLTDTLSAPASKIRCMSSRLAIPPPTVSGTLQLAAVR